MRARKWLLLSAAAVIAASYLVFLYANAGYHDSDDRVRPENIQKIEPGMHYLDVRAIFGYPCYYVDGERCEPIPSMGDGRNLVRDPATGIYGRTATWEGEWAILTVTFEDDRVIEKTNQVKPMGNIKGRFNRLIDRLQGNTWTTVGEPI